MAKNKNRDRKRPHAERARQEDTQSPMEVQVEERATEMTPADAAPKGRHKRFGHN